MRGTDDTDIPKNSRDVITKAIAGHRPGKIQSGYHFLLYYWILAYTGNMRLLSFTRNGATAALQFLALFLLTQIGIATKTPEPPKLSFLYTAYVECEPNLMTTVAGPHGIRKAIPIVGGNFSGPHLSGTKPPYFGKLPRMRNDLTTVQGRFSTSGQTGV